MYVLRPTTMHRLTSFCIGVDSPRPRGHDDGRSDSTLQPGALCRARRSSRALVNRSLAATRRGLILDYANGGTRMTTVEVVHGRRKHQQRPECLPRRGRGAPRPSARDLYVLGRAEQTFLVEGGALVVVSGVSLFLELEKQSGSLSHVRVSDYEVQQRTPLDVALGRRPARCAAVPGRAP